MKKSARALTLATVVNAALLLGCINGSLLGTKGPAANKPAASPTPRDIEIAFKKMKGRFSGLANASGSAIDAISLEDERAIGQAAAINIIQQSGGLVLEQGLVTYVNAVANHVGLQGQRANKGKDGIARMKARRFFVGVLNDDSLNAYALPGGYILLTRGLLQNMTCEADLAWVLGHEIAHIDNEDGLKALKLTVGSAAFGKELLNSPNSDKKTDEETATFKNPQFFARVADKLTEIAFKLGMGREDERTADTQGLMYSTVAGYDAQAARRVLELLATNPQKRTIFSSHDDPATRIQLLNKQMGGLTAGKLGVERYDRGCIQRIEAAKQPAAAAPTPAPAPASASATP